MLKPLIFTSDNWENVKHVLRDNALYQLLDLSSKGTLWSLRANNVKAADVDRIVSSCADNRIMQLEERAEADGGYLLYQVHGFVDDGID